MFSNLGEHQEGSGKPNADESKLGEMSLYSGMDG